MLYHLSFKLNFLTLIFIGEANDTEPASSIGRRIPGTKVTLRKTKSTDLENTFSRRKVSLKESKESSTKENLIPKEV